MTTEKRTFFLDSARGALDGVHYTMVQTVLLLVAVRYFDTADSLKSLIAAAPFIGSMLSPFLISLVPQPRFKRPVHAAILTLTCALGYFFAVRAESGPVFTVIVSVSMILFAARPPFLLGVYEENYLPEKRGRLYSTALLFLVAVSIVASYGFGRMLKADIRHYKIALIAAGMAGVISTAVILKMPSAGRNVRAARNPLKNFSLIYRKPVFGYMLLVWFIFGFANLWTKPLKVVYLAEAERGLNLSPMTVMVILGIVPEATRLIFTRPWARLFDRMNFIAMRILLNAFLAVGVLIFFISTNPFIIGLGSFCQGLGFAGGTVAWNLWVTRVAPRGESHIYMSIHTFFTGLRGFVGPYVGFLFIYAFPVRAIGMVSFAIILVSIAMMVPLIRMGKRI
jgi:MFS family permease